MRVKRHLRALVAHLRSLGAEDVAVVSAGKHPRLTFRVGGRAVSVSAPGSPGDNRADVNMRAFLARVVAGAPTRSRPGAPAPRST